MTTPPLDPHEAPRLDDEAPDASLESHPHREHAPTSADLQGRAPRLASPDARQLNRNVLLLAALLVGVLVLGIGWMVMAQGPKKPAKAVEEDEALVVPELRRERSLLPGASFGAIPAATPMPAPAEAEPIPLRPRPSSRYGDIERLTPAVALSALPAPHVPTLRERRMDADSQPAGAAGARTDPALAAVASLNAIAARENGLAPAAPAVDNDRGRRAMSLDKPRTLLLRGTVIRCVLETRIITDVPGFTSCVVTEPVYSFTGKHVLLAKGSRVMGKYAAAPTTDRVAVIWDRVVTPGGIDVNMASPGIDTLGGAGHPGHYNGHWGSRIGAAVMISLFSDAFKYAAAKNGPQQIEMANGMAVQSPYESNTAETVQQLADQAVQRAANHPATVTINQGTLLAIYVARDVDFSGVTAKQ